MLKRKLILFVIKMKNDKNEKLEKLINLIEENSVELNPPLKIYSHDELNKILGKFLDIFVHSNEKILWEEILCDFSSFQKFQCEVVPLDANLNACMELPNFKDKDVYLHDHVALKLKDPGCFFITYQIGKIAFKHALYDLGASVGVMPLHVFQSLNLNNLMPTDVSLQLIGSTECHVKSWEILHSN